MDIFRYKIIKIMRSVGLKIDTICNLGITFSLNDCSYKSYNKLNNKPLYMLVEYVQIIASYPDGLNEELPSLLAVGTKYKHDRTAKKRH